MQEDNEKKSDLTDLSELYLFEEVYKFMRESTGIAITTAYLILLLSSMAYIYVFYSAFDIQIVKYVTFEDILATPLKNPDIILAFFAILLLLYIVDIGNRFRARQRLKFANKEKTWLYKFVQIVFWTPRKRRVNLKVTAFTTLFFLGTYIFTLAHTEAADIKQGAGEKVEILLTEPGQKITSVLLGISINYVFTYDAGSQESVAYYVESITSIKPVKTKSEPGSTQLQTDDVETESLPQVVPEKKD